MRTTIDIDDDVFRQLTKLAANSQTTLRSVIADVLRAELARRSHHGKTSTRPSVITFRGNGVLPGVNLDSNADLLDLMEGRE